jgi:hypothetical protein
MLAKPLLLGKLRKKRNKIKRQGPVKIGSISLLQGLRRLPLKPHKKRSPQVKTPPKIRGNRAKGPRSQQFPGRTLARASSSHLRADRGPSLERFRP